MPPRYQLHTTSNQAMEGMLARREAKREFKVHAKESCLKYVQLIEMLMLTDDAVVLTY